MTDPTTDWDDPDTLARNRQTSLTKQVVQAMVGRLKDQAFDRYAPKEMLRKAAALLTALSNEVATSQAEIERLREAVCDLADNMTDWDGVASSTEAILDHARAELAANGNVKGKEQ